jgi:hypothetical protein
MGAPDVEVYPLADARGTDWRWDGMAGVAGVSDIRMATLRGNLRDSVYCRGRPWRLGGPSPKAVLSRTPQKGRGSAWRRGVSAC